METFRFLQAIFDNKLIVTFVLQVDSVEKVREIVGETDCSCVLIHKNLKRLLCLELELDRTLQQVERNYVTQPVFKLPAK